MIFNNKHNNNQTNSKSLNFFKYINNYNYTTKEITESIFAASHDESDKRKFLIIKSHKSPKKN